MKNNLSLKKRITLIDELRALSILFMVLYHTLFLLHMQFNVEIPFLFSSYFSLIRDIFSGGFVLISGVVCNYSRSNFKRGLTAFALAMLITLVTYLFLPQFIIIFGVLHMLSISMMLVALLKPILNACSTKIALPLFIALFLITFSLPKRYLNILAIVQIPLPNSLYETPFLFPIGLQNSHFYSSDFYPLIPWFFLYLTGFYLGKILTNSTLPAFFYKTHSRFLCFLGKHSLIIYMTHQVIIFAILSLLFLII